MSRKTIVIKMPSAGQAIAGETSRKAGAASGAKALAGAFGSSADPKTDRWIHAEDVVPLPDNSTAPSAPGIRGLRAAAPGNSTIDLAADRTFAQVLALSFVLPWVLGSFWVANAVNRYWQLFAVPR